MAIISKNLQNKLDNLKTNLQVFVDATGRNPTTEEAKEIMKTGSADSVLQKLQNTANTAKPINTHQKNEYYSNDNSNDNSNEYYSNDYSNDNSDYTPEPAQESGGGNGLLIGGLAVGILGIILLTRGGGGKKKRK